MGVQAKEELLCKVAHLFASHKISKDFLLRAAIQYANEKKRVRDNRDRWKMKKRLES